MREGLALTARHLRSAWRRTGTWAALILALLALAAVLTTTTGSTRLSASLLLVAAVAFGAGAWAGGLLPADRAEGRAAWLATLRPPAGLRRLGAAFAGAVFALVVAVVGALTVGLVVRTAAPSTRVRAVEGLDAPVGSRVPADGGRLVVAVPDGPAGRTLELVLSPRYVRREASGEAVHVRTHAGEGAPAARVLPHGAPLEVDLPAGATQVEVLNESPAIQLVVREARVLGRDRPLLLSALLAGLLLGAGAATVAPVAVLVSRFTSGPTASVAALVIAVAGGLHILVDDVTAVVGGEFEAFGLAVLREAARLAPDWRPLGAFTEPGDGYALGLPALAALAPIGLYALAVLLLVAVPLPGSQRAGGEA